MDISIPTMLVGGPTVQFAYAGAVFVTDPTFDEPRSYGPLRKTSGPAVDAASLPDPDVVLLSHDHHPDNLDKAGREFLTRAGLVVSTVDAAVRVPGVTGLAPWQSIAVPGTNITVTATPARHGPPLVARSLGAVAGFVVEAPSWPIVYFTGDNASIGIARQVARRFPGVGVVIACAGAARISRLPGALLTMNARRVARVAALWPKASVVPVHHDSWAHFTEQSDRMIERWPRSAVAPVLLTPGVPVDIAER